MIQDTGERLLPEGNNQTLTYGEHLARYQAVIELVKGKKVLDVASGAGYGSQMLARSAASVDGLDYSQDAVDYAKDHFPLDNLRYKLGDAQNMPYSDGEFDVVVSLETIEHIPDPESFVREVKRVLKPEGVFIVSTPNDDEFMDGNEFHVHEFQFKELSDLITSNFSKYNYYYQGTYFTAGLLKADEFSGGFSAKPLDVSLTFGQPVDKAIYFIAVASNSSQELPQLLSSFVVADRWSTKEDLERDAARQEHLKRLGEEKQALNDDIAKKDLAIKVRDDELSEIKASKVWKILVSYRKKKDALTKKS